MLHLEYTCLCVLILGFCYANKPIIIQYEYHLRLLYNRHPCNSRNMRAS